MSAKRFWTLFLLLFIVTLLPIAITEIAAFADYPNCLARARVLAHYSEDPFFQKYWRPAWSILPNVLTDVMMVVAVKILPITIAGRVVLGTIVLAIGVGVALARKAVTGTYDALGFGGLLLVYGFPLEMGFLNFSLGVGLLLILFSLHLRLREGGVARYLGILVPAGCVLFLCHLMTFVLFGLVSVAWEIAQSDRSRLKASLARLAAMAVLPALMFLASPTREQIKTWTPSSVTLKLHSIPLSFMVGERTTDLTFAVGMGVLIGLLIASKARWSRPAFFVLALIAGIFLLAPFGLGTTRNLDNRIPYVMGLFAITLLQLGTLGTGSRQRLVSGVLFGTLLLHGALLTSLAVKRGHLIDAMRSQMRTLPEESLLFSAIDSATPVWQFDSWYPPLTSANTLALIDRNVFPSGLFMVEGQQPLLMKSELNALFWARGGSNLDPVELAREIDANLRPLPQWVKDRPRFLMVSGPSVPSSRLPLFLAGPRYAIYRLSR